MGYKNDSMVISIAFYVVLISRYAFSKTIKSSITDRLGVFMKNLTMLILCEANHEQLSH